MRKLFVVFFVLMMVSVGMSSAIFWDIQKLFTGRQMIYYGAPWIADDQVMYFGTGKDVGIEYDETTNDKGEFSGAWFFSGTASIDVVEVSANQTTYTAATVPQWILSDPDPYNNTITLPDAATLKGVPIIIQLKTAPGLLYVRINATGGDLINGVTNYGCTGNAGDKIILMSNASTSYADYWLIDSTGTWITVN